MAKTMVDVDVELLCAICHEELDDPRFLPCHHYFCAACIQSVADAAGVLQNNSSSFQKMAQILRRRSFPCPECRKNTVLPGNNARNLPQAFVVNRMKESLKKLRSKPASALNVVTAQSCSVHDIALKLLCLDCQQMICPECVLSTHKYHRYEYPDQVSRPVCHLCSLCVFVVGISYGSWTANPSKCLLYQECGVISMAF